MNCPYCQKEMTPQGNRCPLCGGNLNVRLCSRGHVMDPSWDTCHFCPQGEGAAKPKQMTEIEVPQAAAPSRAKGGTIIETPSHGSGKSGTVVESTSAANKLVGWLVSFDWDKSGQDYKVREGKNTIGRDARSCDIAIPQDTQLSNVHATLIYRNGKFLLGDEHSMNGTFVNDKDISMVQLSEVQNNDLITVGNTKLKLKVL